jgi:hypothetical protein
VIVDVEATRAIRQAEVGAAKTMIDRTEERLGLIISANRDLAHCSKKHHYSITSSASASTVGGEIR